MTKSGALVLVDLFDDQIRQRPDAVAVVYQNRRWTYGELGRKADRAAQGLRRAGVEPRSLVGLSMVPSPEMIAAVWGILKAGCAFVPLDPAYPSDRLKFMVADSRISTVVADSGQVPDVFGSGVRLLVPDASAPGAFCLDSSEFPTTSGPLDPPAETISGDHPACCLYTSGSTGQPKGVLMEHRVLSAHCLAIQTIYGYDPTDRILLFASLNYVAALEQLFLPLLVGAGVVIREPELWDSHGFPEKVREHGITVVDLPPEYWHTLLEVWVRRPQLVEALPLRLVILGGDVTRPETIRLWQRTPLKSVRLLNAYGMTETPVTATLFEIPADHGDHSVPIGKPVPGRSAFILDEELQPVPDGEAGELCMGGDSLARGYLNRPALTEAKFIRNPFGTGRLYRTGDLARYRPDGHIEYLGRMDHQVKIRGFRVELGEIEAALKGHRLVKDAVAMTRGEGSDKRIVACVVPKDHVPLELVSFKLRQHNVQAYEGSKVGLSRPACDRESILSDYLARQSYRQFAQRAVPFAHLGSFLSCLSQLRLPDVPIPKYRYPSSAGLYPVQTYLYLKRDRIEGIQGGLYYYHPVEHQLVLLRNNVNLNDIVYGAYHRSMAEQSAFTLFLIAHTEATNPFVSDAEAEKSWLLEAGYMGQLLMREAPKHDIGLCPLNDPLDIHKLFDMPGHLVPAHLFLGGAIEPRQQKTWLQEETEAHSVFSLEGMLHNDLSTILPQHMLPDIITVVRAIPMTPNGKPDRRSLLDATPAKRPSAAIQAPATELERLLADIVQDILQVRGVDVHTPFFEMGVNSLKMLRIQNRLQVLLRRTVPIVDLFGYPTIHQLAGRLGTTMEPETSPLREACAPGDPKPSRRMDKRNAFLEARRKDRRK